MTRIEQEMVAMMDAFAKDIAQHHFFIGTSIFHWAMNWQINRSDIDKPEVTEDMDRMSALLASQLNEVLQAWSPKQ